MRARLAVVLAIVCAGTAVGVGVGSGPADAAPQDCEKRGGKGQCVTELPVTVPGTPAAGSENPSGVPSGNSGQPASRSAAPSYTCRWATVGDPPDSAKAAFPGAPPDAIWQVFICGEGAAVFGSGGGTGWRWLPPGGGPPSAPTPPEPGVVAALVFARVKAEMVAPTLATDPPVGVAAVVNTPVFVEVTNWQPEIVESDCILGVCVTMTATPALAFDPGDGSGAIGCVPPGSRYDPARPLMEQAEGACAHVYRQRTAAEGRPGAWPGQVTVTWSVSWTSNVGASGSYDRLSFAASLPRVVEEVSTVVVDGSS